VHCPNPGRMRELLIPGRDVILEKKQTGKTSYSLAAVLYQGQVIPLNAARSNRVAEQLALPILFPYSSELRREVSIGNSRFDFRLGNGSPTYVEVKTCTLVEEGVALFPDAPTIRGVKHLQELGNLVEQGNRAAVVFMLMSPRARRFLPNMHTDPLFTKTLIELQHKIRLFAVSTVTDSDGTVALFDAHIPVDLDSAESLLADRGAYLLVLTLSEDREIAIGQLGTRMFRRGYYVYVGSAMKNLTARIARHHRHRKKKHWHIDFLREYTAIDSFPIRSVARQECALARDVSRLAAGSVPGFGSSDCTCAAHLYTFARDPLLDERFVSLLFRYRHRV